MTASSGSIMEFYRQLINELDIHIKSNSKTIMLRLIKKEIIQIVREIKMKVVLLVDEASLLRLEVFAELHTICHRLIIACAAIINQINNHDRR